MSGGRWRVSGRALGDERGTLEGERGTLEGERGTLEGEREGAGG